MKTLFISFVILLSPFSAQAAENFTVATFNTWGVPLAVWDTFRYANAMKALEAMSPDVIFLQEVFSKKGKRDFSSDTYPYVAYGPKGFPRIFGSGLKILSRHPIERTAILKYGSCKGMDCFAKKGAVLAVITLANGQKMNLITTHLNTSSEQGDGQEKQVRQLLEFIDTYAEKNAPILIGGDFNFEPGSKPYRLITEELHSRSERFNDAWQETHALDLVPNGFTCDTFDNPYANRYAIKTHSEIVKKRIDFLFSDLEPLTTKVILDEKPYYSDHYGLWAEYAL